ncbi:hypothetical protein TSTA_043140 [Talaromyces stipitatus ATCC 10500]|uniref:Protein HRI1 n=1 Tax=Talaromyces stipitatus (strain ATCC 10500 / CBS 375.48 / QM 6759 / NRRL 1006) TaxID=441959 RepID=B8MK22_TALSN|nr:uncharacterized protein TSTA_043140 [Talaromyces stipitatus ATCC 10500]EED14839.1 hypothetical protein TSTA_043140 [Talaromyces stipitatus ATCC 10500]
MNIRASTLISVQWPPEPVSEGPDTLVLSVGTYYVDLRVNRHDGSIYWTLAGRRIVVSEDPRKVKFTHEIDSHKPHRNASSDETDDEDEEEEEVADEGEFTKLPNGDDLEIGEMPAPHLGGKVAAYREIWRELKIGFDDNDDDDDDDDDGGDDAGKGACWVLESLNNNESEVPNKGKKKRTFYCKVGKFFLALRRTETDYSETNEIGKKNIEFSVIRQELINKTEEDWVTKYSIGTEVNNMFHLSKTSVFALQNANGKSTWSDGDRILVSNKRDASVREVCIVRAVN